MPKPVIGLALGSGVARGWAHIGVIRALERAGYAPDIVCGTSIGALAGGTYLAGQLDELEQWALDLTPRRMFGYLDLKLGGSGLIGGDKLAEQMQERLGDVRIEHLQRRFVAVATELATGHEIWLRTGGLVDAIRASYALPGVFRPVKIDRRWLIDGALVNPVPVSVCRAFGARVVIAVNLTADVFGKGTIEAGDRLEDDEFDAENKMARSMFGGGRRPERLLLRQLFGTSKGAPGITTVMLASLNIVQDRLARSRLAGDPPDVIVNPRVGHIGLLEFDRAKEAIELGENAMERALPFLHEAMAILS